MIRLSPGQLFKASAAVACALGVVSLALIYFIPAPPSKVVMATAFKGASFEYYGRQYREIFARSHVELELRETAGAVENYKKAVDAAPDSPQYRGNLARGLLELGKFREALQEYRKIETIASLPGFGMAPKGHLSYSAGFNMRARRTQPWSVRGCIDSTW